jgi:tRNA threonylcarbamoyladenosine biosynthesis protein TsaB
MSLILNIDTAVDNATLSIAENGNIIKAAFNNNQKEHATFLHKAIKQMFASASLSMNNLDAIAVTEGPGSYTGLRVGMSTAKGLCYALQKPLITICTLKMMAKEAVLNYGNEADLFCPMIDARRMEVFTAVFTPHLECIVEPCAMILNEAVFETQLNNNKIVFLGNGSSKLNNVLVHENISYLPIEEYTNALNKLSFERFTLKNFSDLALSEPKYIKEYMN